MENSYQFFNHVNQERHCSKSQTCPHKILQIIASCAPPQKTSKIESSNPQFLELEENRGAIGIDLNMGDQLDQSESSSISSYSGLDDNHKIDSKNDSCSEKAIIEDGKRKSNDGFSLPIEAAEIVGKETESDLDLEKPILEAINSKRSSGRAAGSSKKKRKCSLVVDLYGDGSTDLSSAVARSERERRKQVLPSSYRDSSVVMEPWKRVERPPRKSAAGMVVSRVKQRKKS